MKKIIFVLFLALVSSLGAMSQTYVAIGKAGKVYDEASIKYVTLNQNNEEVNVIPGMVFKQADKSPGWAKIEYSPGLHAFIPEQLIASQTVAPAPGSYKVTNNPSQILTVEQNGKEWKGSTSGKSYNGKQFDNIVVFFDDSNNPAFSLADIGTGGIVITYDNAITKFF